MVALQFSVVAKNTNMVLRNSQGILFVEEWFELKFTGGVIIPNKSTIYIIVQNVKKQVRSYSRKNGNRTLLNEDML